MRILHISKYYYPYLGGVENICKYIVEGMPQHEMAVLCFNDKRKNVIDYVNGIKVYRVASWVNISKQALSLSYFTMFSRCLKEFKPDIIHFHWANPFPAAVLLTIIPKNVKLVVHWHMDIIKQSTLYKFIRPIETALLKRADMILVTSPNYMVSSIPLQTFKDKVDILPNAIDEKNMSLRYGDNVKIVNIKSQYNGKKIVFFVGRHIQYKGLPYLIEAEKKVKNDCVFVIAGKGPLTKQLKESCNSKRVFFVGRVSDDELRWYNHAASVFAFPSITKNEAFGVALAEAMYCNTPAVTFTIQGSGVNWVCPDGITGIESPNGDSDALANAIDTLLSDDNLCKLLGNNGHKRVVENFTLPIMLKNMDFYYKKLYGFDMVNHCVKLCKSGGVRFNLPFSLKYTALLEERRAA
ncbi:MAG: glycosyltransferase [Prevotella sp.]|nr:glycosyltransferase [Prevotella sp.]